MTAQTAKILVLFLFTGTLVSAGGRNKPSQKPEYDIEHASEGSGKVLTTSIQNAIKDLEKNTDEMRKSRTDFKIHKNFIQNLNNSKNDDNAAFFSKFDEAAAAFKKTEVRYLKGLEEFEKALKTCKDERDDQAHNERIISNYVKKLNKGDDTKDADQMMEKAQKTKKKVANAYEETKGLYDEASRNKMKKLKDLRHRYQEKLVDEAKTIDDRKFEKTKIRKFQKKEQKVKSKNMNKISKRFQRFNKK